jgi:hypothetical protein
MNAVEWFRAWNDVNVSSAKTVLVAIMQACAFAIINLMWAVAMVVQLRHWTGGDVDFHTEFLWLDFGALLALSGINLGGRIANRVTDIDYQLAKNAGKSATAVQVSGDNPNVTTTVAAASTVPVPAPLPPFRRPTRRQSAQMGAVERTSSSSDDAAARATQLAGARSVVTSHDDGVL